MWLNNNLLRDVLYRESTFCCLCLKMCGENTSFIYDQITTENCRTKFTALSTMIDQVFGKKLPKEDLVSDSVCQECAISTINAYKFITKCSEINQELTVTMSNLSESVEEATNDTKSVKQMYIATDSKSLQSVVFMDLSKRKLKDYSGFLTRCHGLITDDNEHVAQFLPSFFHKIECKACDEVLSNVFDFKRHTLEHQMDNDEEVSMDDTQNDSDEHDSDTLRVLLESTPAKKIKCMYCNSMLQRNMLVRHMLNYCKELQELHPDEYGTGEIIHIIISEYSQREANRKQTNITSNLALQIDSNMEVQIVKSEKKIMCQNCGVFCSISYLKRHLKKYCPNNKEPGNKNNMEISENIPVGEHTCDFCKKSFTKKSVLGTHIAYNCKGNPFPEKKKRKLCNYCEKEVAPSNYRKHILGHMGHFNKCQKCGKVFKTDFAYNRHASLKSCSDKYEPTPKNFSCSICNKGFIREKDLTAHVAAVHYNTGFECEYCHKVFPQRFKLKYHMITHTRERNFQCEICAEKFVTKYSLLYHTRRHTGEKPHKCNFCDSRFLSSSRRRMHERIHHMEPELECKYCLKKFRTGNSLNRHEKRHTNPKSSLFMGNKDHKSDEHLANRTKKVSVTSKNYSDSE